MDRIEELGLPFFGRSSSVFRTESSIATVNYREKRAIAIVWVNVFIRLIACLGQLAFG